MAARAVNTKLYPALLCATILGYWLPRLFRGFWIDEAGAYWVAQGGWDKVWHTIQIWPTQSILYAYLSTLFACDGPCKEALLRLPSVVGMLLAAWALYRITEAIVGPGSGWAAVIPFACAGAIVDLATNARPYALGLGIILVSFWSLHEIVHGGDKKWLVVYCCSSALIIHFHYPFVLVFAVQAVYLWAAGRAGRLVLAWQILTGLGAIMAGAIPLIWPFLTLAHVSTRWKTAALPTLMTFLSFYPLQVLFPAAVGFILFWVLYRGWFRGLQPLASDDLVLLFAWLLLGPILLFAFTRISGYAIFATRFLVYALPPFFILLAWSIRQIADQRAQFALVFSIALCAVLYVPQMAISPEWRTPLNTVRSVAGADTPILLRSGFVESSTFDWKREPNPETHLFAPLSAYPLRNKIIPVPFFMDGESEIYLEREILRRSTANHRFCLLAETGSDVLNTLPTWFRNQGYTTSSREIGGFELLLFTAR